MDNMFLPGGGTIPAMAFGTWQIEGDAAYEAVQTAIACGYNHIDTAANYGNEEQVGAAIADLGARKDIFLTTKLKAEIKTYDGAMAAFEESLKKLKTDYLDLYLIHAPWPWSNVGEDCTEGNIEAWRAMTELYRAGHIRSIGVSNFHPEHIKPLVEAIGVKPEVNQIRFFIGNTQEPILKYCMDEGILVEAYSPLATGHLTSHEKIVELAAKYGVTPAQICIRYCIERGTLPVVKSTHKERMLENMNVAFIMEKADVDAITGIEIPEEWKRKLRS